MIFGADIDISVDVAAIVVALAPTIAVLVTYYLQRRRAVGRDLKLGEIHEMVNSRLSKALERVAELEARVAEDRATITRLETLKERRNNSS